MATNVQGQPESPLVVFGGFVSEANPPDIPAGSAVIATDCDYTVASVRTRDGLKNVYSYSGSLVECGPTSAISVAGSDVPWTNPHGIIDTSCASVEVNAPGGPVAPSQLGFNTAVNTTGVASASMPISAGKVVVFCGTAYRAYVVGDTLGSVGPGLFAISQTVLNGGADRTVGMTVVTTRSFAGADTWSVNTTQFDHGASLVVIEYDGLNLGVTPGSSTTPIFDDHIATQGTFSPSTTATPIVAAGVGFTNDAAYQYTESLHDPIAVCVQHMSAGAAGTYPVTFSTNLGLINAGNLTTVSDGDFITAIAILDGATGRWGVCAYAIPVANTIGPDVGPTSQNLNIGSFPCLSSIPGPIVGMELVLTGSQSNEDSSSVLSVTLTSPTNPLVPRNVKLPLSSGNVSVGGSNDTWGQAANLSTEAANPGFGLSIQATSSIQTTFSLCGAELRIWYTPGGIDNFNYVKTFEMTNGKDLTLALDDNGVFWQEDVQNNPNVLAPFYTAIEPDTFARSVTQDDREFIALSDLQMGTDMPRGYNGQWVDRLSQVGPGASPSFNATSNSFDIASITQPPAVTNTGTFSPFRAVLWSSGVGIKHTAGNIFSLYYSFHTSPPDPNVVIGNYVYLANFVDTGGASPNGTYQIIDAGVIAGGPGGPCNYFSVQVPSSQNAYYQPGAGPSYNITMATITLTAPDATVQVGTQIAISGATPSTWDDTWTILAALNAAQLTITATALSGGVATYNFTIISGVAPTVGQQVTVTGTTNGGGIFNVFNGVVNATSPTSFSLLIDAPDIAPAAEANGQAIVNGTTFQFDVGPKFAGTADNPILGNDTGTGTIVQSGQLGAGTRMGTVMFLTRNGFLTAPAPPATFTLNEGANAIVVTNIPIGPPNVIARVIALTGANGAFFFWVPVPVIVSNSGQAITYSSTVIQDNVTTQVTLNLTDAVLLAALSIDSQGANNFAEVELGSCIGITSYASRLFAWGEQNKIQNLLNWSFDGGYFAANQQSNLAPLGWTVDQTNGAGGMLTVSPQFGNAYYIKNATGSTQALYGMIWQSAFQDYNQVPIITPQTEYSVRVTARSPSGAASGNLVIDLFSPSFGVSYGSFSVALSSLTTSMQILTGTLLTTAFTTEVPDDLRLRYYSSQIPDGADVEIDRMEPFNTAQPTLTTQMRGSYFNNFEAFDGVTGNLGVGSQNQQPVRNVFSLFDNLYVVKTKSFYSTSDNGTTEPNFWNVREVSNKVGTPSIYGVDVGEGWALIVGQAGLYIFTGGDPIKISPELDGNPGFWQKINWAYGNTIWLRNDTNNRKVYIGIPIATPNFWLPSFPVNVNPTQPNVVLVLNYKELMTSQALAGEGSMRLTYTGELKTYTLGRKWSAWSIEACYADFITRQDTTEPLFFCGDTATGKIYQQIAGNYADDGKALHCDYVTAGFPKTKEAQELQMGLHQLQASFMSILANGNGNLRMTVYPDSIESPNQEALYPEALYNPPPEGDLEIPLNIEGNRFFVGLQVVDPGEWFEISRIVMALTTNPWAPLRGGNP